MPAAIPTVEPSSVFAGDTWKWQRGLDDYPASSGWVLSYVFTNPSNRFAIASSASGDDHLVNTLAADTAAIKAGVYEWVAFVTLATDRFKVGSGRMEVKPNVAVAQNFDIRSQARRTLDQIKARMEGRSLKDEDSLSIDGVAIVRMKIDDLIKWRSYFEQEVANEEAAERVSAGLGNPRYVGIRFGRA